MPRLVSSDIEYRLLPLSVLRSRICSPWWPDHRASSFEVQPQSPLLLELYLPLVLQYNFIRKPAVAHVIPSLLEACRSSVEGDAPQICLRISSSKHKAITECLSMESSLH